MAPGRSRFTRSSDADPARRPATAATADDALLLALDRLDAVLADEADRTTGMRHRIATLRAELASGRNPADVAAAEPRPRLVELLADSARSLDTAGAGVRRAEARALHDEGMTMDEIAALFGVTRQRVSALLRGR